MRPPNSIGFRLKGVAQYAVLALRSSTYALVGLLVAVVAFPMVFLPSRWSFVIGIVSAVVGLSLWVLTFVREQQAVDDLVLERVEIPGSAIEPLTDAEVGRWLVNGAGRMLVGPAARARLALDAQLTPLRVAYRLPPQLEEMKARIIGRFRKNAEDVVNNTVLGLEFDAPTLDQVADTNQLRLMPVKWFDFKASADMAAWMLVTRTGETCVHVARDYLVGRGGVLQSATHTRLANAVGVSTIAVTVDGAVLLVRQSRRNSDSIGLLAPSGSGSLEPRDWSSDQTLEQLVCAGAEREMCEESLVLPSEIVESHAIGWGRWLERGGKPEFFCVSLLNAPAQAVTSRRHRGLERRHTHGASIPLFEAEGPVTTWARAIEIVGGLAPQRESWSLPLEAGVLLAKQFALTV